jgi:hypothetical protein
MDYLEFIARVVSHIPDKGQITLRYYGLYANAHRGMVKKASQVPVALGMIEEELPPIPSKGWAEMIRSTRLSGSPDGRWTRRRLFFMIFFFPGRRSLYDFRRFRASRQLFDLPRTTSACP